MVIFSYRYKNFKNQPSSSNCSSHFDYFPNDYYECSEQQINFNVGILSVKLEVH